MEEIADKEKRVQVNTKTIKVHENKKEVGEDIPKGWRKEEKKGLAMDNEKLNNWKMYM